MSRFRNDTGSVLTVNDLMRQVGPYEEFDWPGHDPEVHGLISGCTWLDAPQPAAEADSDGGQGDDPGDAGLPEITAAASSGETSSRTSRKRKSAGDEDKETTE